MRMFLRAALVVSGLTLAAGASYAKPEYAKKEMKVCGYCHVNPAGGGPRNPHGAYYGMHDHTFKGLPPEYKSLWKMDIAQPAMRVLLGDVTGDKTARLILVTAAGKATVNKVGDDKLTEEATIELGKDAGKAAVGTFAKGKPAIIVVPGAIYSKDGEKYVRKEAKDISDITGSVRFTDGTENVFSLAGGGMPEVWAIDPSAANPSSPGRDMVPPDQAGGVYATIVAHIPGEMLTNLGVPAQGQKAPVIALVDPRNTGDLFWLTTWNDNNEWTLRAVALAAFAPGGGTGDTKALWESPKLGGRIVDIAIGPDPLARRAPVSSS